MDLYQARPEAREYLDFFVKPDIDKKLEKAKANIHKELSRQSRGRNRSRSTRVRRFIKDISSLNPGPEPVLEVMAYTIEEACRIGADQWIKTTTQLGYCRLLNDTILYADSCGLLSDILPRLEKAIDDIPSSFWRGNEFKRLLREHLNTSLESL